MRKITYLILFFLVATIIQAQEERPKLYDPMADARLEISETAIQAKAENKHVLLMVGGNW